MTSHNHQFSVVASVDDHYRVLSTVQCSYPSAHAVLKRCLGILKIFQDASNRMPIQQELQAAKGFAALSQDWDREWHAHSSKPIPLPFITTCLIVGTSFTFDEGYHFEAACKHLRTGLAVGLFSVTGEYTFLLTTAQAFTKRPRAAAKSLNITKLIDLPRNRFLRYHRP